MDDLGARAVDSITIVVTGTPALPPEAAFETLVTGNRSGAEVRFTDLSEGMATQRMWNFGDGTSSMAADPVHLYRHVGTYTVRLIVTGSGGGDTEEKADLITISIPAPVAWTLPRRGDGNNRPRGGRRAGHIHAHQHGRRGGDRVVVYGLRETMPPILHSRTIPARVRSWGSRTPAPSRRRARPFQADSKRPCSPPRPPGRRPFRQLLRCRLWPSAAATSTEMDLWAPPMPSRPSG